MRYLSSLSSIITPTFGIMFFYEKFPWIVVTTAVTTAVVIRALLPYIFPKKLLRLQDKYVVITGCDTGFGSLAVDEITKSGAKVIAMCLTVEGCKAAITSGASNAIQCDLADSGAIARAAVEIKTICKEKLWAVVHNAGIVQAGFIDFQPVQNFRKTMEINFFAIVDLNQRLMPFIKKAKGRVVFITSVDGIVSLPGNAPYDASKFACEAFADALRVESSFWDVHVSVINPSTMKTPLAMGFFSSQRNTWDAMEKVDPDGLWKQEWSKEWLEKHIETNTPGIASIAEDPLIVVKDVVDAVASSKPKSRYLSGFTAKTLFYFLWVAPESWSFAFKKSIVNPRPNIALS